MRRKIQKVLIIFFILFICAITAALFYFKWSIMKPLNNDSGSVVFEIEKGQGKLEISKKLEDKGVIRSALIFLLAAEIKNKSLLPGLYELSLNMNIIDILESISTGKTKMTKVLIPEGYRVEQIAQTLVSKNLADYDGFIAASKGEEGYLFPDTYYFSNEITEEKIVAQLKENFKRRTEDLAYSEEDIIIASIVEREAIKDEERPLIAGIYKNRLKKDMKLEADPTVQYAKDNLEMNDGNANAEEFKFWKPITSKDYLTVISDFNTYIAKGLPPAPICNPGLKSIEATINYQKHNYIYFLQKDGKIYPSENAASHEYYKETILRGN